MGEPISSVRTVDEHVDLLIVGAGPAGLMAAAWAAVCGIETKVVDQRAAKIVNGHADGLQSRTLEILDSFDIGQGIYKEANRLQEVCFWNPDQTGVIKRTDRIPDTIPGISRFQQSVLHQGRIEQYFLDLIERNQQVVIERSCKPVHLDVDQSLLAGEDEYPITVRLQTTNLECDEKTVRCKYMVGCDGAHSWVREQIGVVMEGEHTESVWGVMDIVPITNFPDIRMRCTIHSAGSGTIMVIPRERGLVRLYIQLANLAPAKGERFAKSEVSPETIFEAAKGIFSPYEISYEYCEWWTVYQVGQRVANAYGAHNRIFLAGDAVHTHSPKAGQGMNVSMQDAYNLGWKIASVLQKTTKPAILSTYESERRMVALELIEFDRQFARMFSGRPARDIADEAGISMSNFKETFEKGNVFTSGVSVRYGAGLLVAKISAEEQDRQEQRIGRIQTGRRFPSVQVVSQADATARQLADCLKSDGLWRLILFAGDLSHHAWRRQLEQVSIDIGSNASLNRLLSECLLEAILVHASPRRSIEMLNLPQMFYRRTDKSGLDYYRVYADDTSYHHGHGNAFHEYGIDKEKGCSVLVRPDQHVGWIGQINDIEGLEMYLEGIFR